MKNTPIISDSLRSPVDINSLKNDLVFNRPRLKISPEAIIRGIDIELTNYCNASCYYCPRDLINSFWLHGRGYL